MAPEDLQLAAQIHASAPQFATLFEKLQPQQPPTRLDALANMVVSQEEQIARGIAYARAHRWLENLIVSCILEGLAERELVEEAERQALISPDSSLQSILEHARGFSQAGVVAAEIPKIVRQVCRIDVGGRARGTGFLVQPDMVVTAYHVVSPMIANGKPLPHSHRQIRVVFDNYSVMADGFTLPFEGRSVGLVEDWLVGASPCHDRELVGELPDDFDQLLDRFDFALIRLKGAARVGLPPVRFASGGRLRRDDQIHIFQHPDGRPLSIDRKNVREILGADVRFYHDVNTQSGSSGSPCFNDEFRVVGMHQAGPKNGPCTSTHGQLHNRGVPAHHLMKVLATLESADPRLSPLTELVETRPGHPVFGRTETQEWVWREVRAPSRPILALSGERGRGRSFTYDILRTLLPTAAHDVLKISAASIASSTPEGFASYLLNELRYPHPALPEDTGDTTPVRWQRDTLLAELLGSLEVGRSLDAKGAASIPRDVWILIDDIDKSSIGTGSPISDFLYALYSEAATRPWLRFVLLGYAGDLPPALRPLAQSYELRPSTDDELYDYLFSKAWSRVNSMHSDFTLGFAKLAKMEADTALAAKAAELIAAAKKRGEETLASEAEIILAKQQAERDAASAYLEKLQERLRLYAQALIHQPKEPDE